jgi:hypothetical protein
LTSTPIGEDISNYSLGAFIELLPEAVVITDRKLTVVEFNHAVLNVLGSIERGSELSVGNEWQNYRSDVLLYISTGKTFEFPFTSANSGYIATFLPVVSRDGRDFVYCSLHPSGQAADTGQTLQRMIEAIPFPLFVLDAEGNSVSCNSEATGLLPDGRAGFNAGKPFSDILESSSRPMFDDMLRQCGTGVRPVSKTLEFAGGSGPAGRDPVKFTITPYDSGRNGKYYFLTGRTHRRHQAYTSHADGDAEAVKLLHLMSGTEQFADKDSYFSKMAQGISEVYEADAVIIFEEIGGVACVIGETACPVGISRRLLSRDGGNAFESSLMQRGEETIVDTDSPYRNAMKDLYSTFETLVSVPLVYDGKPIGAIFLLHVAQASAEEEDRIHLPVLAGMAAGRLAVFRRIQGIRLESEINSILWDMMRKLEKSFRSPALYQSLSKELRYLFDGYTSFTFFRQDAKSGYTLAAADGAQPEGSCKSVVPGEAIDDPAEKSDVWILGMGHKQLREALHAGEKNDVVIVRHSAQGLSGFTAIVCRGRLDEESPAFFAARRAVSHINFIISSVRQIERQERRVMRARLLNLFAETSVSGIPEERRLDELVRCVRESFRPNEIAVFSLKDGVSADGAYLKMARNSARVDAISRHFQAEINACAASLNYMRIEMKTDDIPADGTALKGELLLIPAGSAGGAERVISVVQAAEQCFDYDDIEFAEVLSRIVSRSEHQRRRMEEISDSEQFYRSLSSVTANFNAHLRDRPRAGTLSNVISGVIQHDDMEVLADTGDGFARRTFTLRGEQTPGRHALISLTDIFDVPSPNEGRCITRNNTRIPSLFGQSVGSALVCRLMDGQSPRGSVVLWRKSPWAFSKREGMLLEAVISSLGPLLIEEWQ